jgi:hypothetical protein
MANPGQLPNNDTEDMSLRFDIGDASFVNGAGSTNVSLTGCMENLGYSRIRTIPQESLWYGANTGYYVNDGVNDYISGAWSRSYNLTNNDWSVVCWLKTDQSTKANAIFWSFAASTPGSADRVYLQYNSAFNRLVVNLRTNSQNFLRAFALHDNSTQTGITNSGTGWTTGQRGNTNSAGWTMITVTYDASQSTPAAAFKIYWNTSELTVQAAAPNQGRTAFTPGSMYLMDLADQAPGSNNAEFSIDEWKYFETVLNSTNVSNLYNSGVIRNNSNLPTISVTQTQVSFDRASEPADDVAGYWSPTITGGVRAMHSSTSLNT